MAKARNSEPESAAETASEIAPEIASDTEEADAAPRLGQFESSVAELEALVEALEAGDISLEKALGKFERGVTLSRRCQTLLKNAELRVDQLLAQGEGESDGRSDGERIEAFDNRSADESD